MVMPEIFNSDSHHTPSTHSHQMTSIISPSLLSTADEYSSRYSSLQESESLKSAILDSFRMHWIQAWSIMECKILNDITLDDLSSIVNHLEQMISLLIEGNVTDVRAAVSMNDLKTEQISAATSSDCSDPMTTSSLNPLLDFLSTESILEKIFQWSEMSGQWKHVMYLEQLKIYELLISQLCQIDIVLIKPSFFQPLVYLLDALSTFLVSNYFMINYIEIEKRLVLLLNTLCVSISQNKRLLNLFIVYPNTTESSFNKSNKNSTAITNSLDIPKGSDSSLEKNICCDKQDEMCDEQSDFSFSIFSLLIHFVHREGPIGQQSRDAILLCLAMSQHNERLAYYVANKTDFCPVLATGLSGYFSSLPRVLIAHSTPSEHFQLKHEFICGSKEIDHFLKCLDFCNAVVQISHPIIQVQLLKYIFNGFLISVIGPALHQDVANVSVNDLETMPSYSNTLDVIITTTAYLDLFIRTISEPKLIRIFLEFLCFEVYDNNYVIVTLINRINAKSKLSLVTLIFFKTLLDLNCEDLLYELIFKYLLRGKHLKKETDKYLADKKYSQCNQSYQSYQLYQDNWLAISAHKLLSSSLSYYLSSLCPHQILNHSHYSDTESVSSFDASVSCKCHSNYFFNYLDYLNDARNNIDQCFQSTKLWRNSYYEPCHLLNEVQDQNIIFCTIDRSNLNNNNDECCYDDEDVLDINDIITQNSLMAKFSPGFKMKNCYYDCKLKKISYKIEPCKPLFGMINLNSTNNDPSSSEPQIGLFLSILFKKFEKFFQNDLLINLHLTGLLTRLCHFSHKLLLSLLFDETLLRTKNVPCFIHILQKLSLEAQNYFDEIPDFESIFQAAKSNLQSMPLGELDCTILASNSHLRGSNNSLVNPVEPSDSGYQHKAIGLLKNFFFRSSNIPSKSNRRPSIVSTSSTGQMLEVVPGGIRFINQNSIQNEGNLSKKNNTNKFNELVYNLIIFDEFLMELSAILIEHSVREFHR